MRNGVRVITEQMVHVRSVSLGVWITTGSRCEAPDENGISHFIEHMVFKSTRRRSDSEIAGTIDNLFDGPGSQFGKEFVAVFCDQKIVNPLLTVCFCCQF